MADELTEDVGQETDFDPSSLPLGTFTAFDVSDQPMWTTAENAQNKLNDDQKNAIEKMVDSCETWIETPSDRHYRFFACLLPPSSTWTWMRSSRRWSNAILLTCAASL